MQQGAEYLKKGAKVCFITQLWGFESPICIDFKQERGFDMVMS